MMTDTEHKIACIGWGSLIWDRQELPVRGVWHDDGPLLPVEFARQSKRDGKISLVICPDVPRVRVLWALLDVPDMATAKQVLATREGIPRATAKTIGYLDRANGVSHGEETQTIEAWSALLDLEGVVWTNLSYGLAATDGVMPRDAEVVAYLSSLKGEVRAKAEEYVRKAPEQIDTPYRRIISHQLGWTYQP